MASDEAYTEVWFDKPPLYALTYLLWDAQIGFALRWAGVLFVGLASALGFVSGEDKQEKTTVITLAGGSAGQQWCSVRRRCFDALVPGGRLICVVGDVCLSRRKNNGRHTVVPLHASIQERCRAIGYDNLAPIIWHKIANAVYEVDNGSAFLGKPYEPNSVVKNDIEFILMQRKPGGYRKPSVATRVLSVISAENHQKWFQQIWEGLTGASTRNHPAPFPVELASRLIQMFSFVGDTVLDPFSGTGTTTIAAMQRGRNSLAYEVDPEYYRHAKQRINHSRSDFFSKAAVTYHELPFAQGRGPLLESATPAGWPPGPSNWQERRRTSRGRDRRQAP